MTAARRVSGVESRTRASVLLLVLSAGLPGCWSATESGDGILSAAYALSSVDGVPLPVVLSIAGSEERRIIADTLRFPARGFYTETTISQATTGTAPPIERVDRESAPYVSLGGGTIQLPVFVGVVGTATVTSSTLTVAAGQGRVWVYSVVR
jgi:hypothetical protein